MALFLWVLFPLGLAGLTSHYLAARENDIVQRASTARLGRLGASLLREEMGARSTSLAQDARTVGDPDLRSPLIRAALEGDTVAALGISSGELTLSLALAREAGDSLELHAITVPFAAESLDLLRTRAGIGAALYLRDRKARGSPGDFGPATLPVETEEDGVGPLPAGGVILPLAGPVPGPSPARILVAPLAPVNAGPSPWRTLFLILLAWASASLIWLIPPRRRGTAPGWVRKALLVGVPLLHLWVLLGALDRVVEAEADTLLRQDLIRVMAAVREGGRSPPQEEIFAATGFHLLERNGREMKSTDLPPTLDATVLGDIPAPASSTPTLGRVGHGGSRIVYAALAEETGSELLLATPEAGEGLVSFRLLLAGLGGMASLLALGFLAWGSRNSVESPSG